MKNVIAVAVMAAMLASTVALGAQTPVPPGATSNDYWARYTRNLPIGATVRVRTIDGSRMTAVLAIVDDTGITIQPKTRIPEPPLHIPFDRLAQVEPEGRGPGLLKAVAIGAGVGAAAFLGMFVIALASISD